MIAFTATLLLLSGPPEVDGGTILRHQTFHRTDGTVAHGSVYLPKGYSAEISRRYPVLILLHGLGGEDTDWFGGGYLVDILDRAIAAGRLQPVIVVMPDGGNGYWTDWVTDRDARFRSLVEPETRLWVQRKFRTDGRIAIGGISMGGFGALSIALQNPGRYAAVLSFSGALFRQFPTGRSVYLRAFGYPGLKQGRFAFVNPIVLATHGMADKESIWLDCGSADRARFTKGLRMMSNVLSDRGVSHIAKFRPGRHHWDVWLAGIEDSLPWLNDAFERAQPMPFRSPKMFAQPEVERRRKRLALECPIERGTGQIPDQARHVAVP